MNSDDNLQREDEDLTTGTDPSPDTSSMPDAPELDDREPRFGERIGDPYENESDADSPTTDSDTAAGDMDEDKADEDLSANHTAM